MDTRGDQISDDLGHFEEPDFRATIRDGRLRLHEWTPFLFSGGPARDFFRARRDDGVAIADIRRWRNVDGSGELSVEFLSGGGRPAAEDVPRALGAARRLPARCGSPIAFVDLS